MLSGHQLKLLWVDILRSFNRLNAEGHTKHGPGVFFFWGGGGGRRREKGEGKKITPSFAASEYREEGHDRRLVLPLHALHALRKIESALSRSFLLWVGDFF